MEFKRFVSYVYEYAGEEKLHNCGFVKVEVRQEMVRFGIHLQTKKKNRDKCRIYGFVRKEERLEGVLIGETAVQNGIVDVRFLKQVQSVSENPDIPIPFEQLGGIVFMMEGGSCYSTVWDEDGFSMGNFQKPKERNEKTADRNEKTANENGKTTGEKEQTEEEKNSGGQEPLYDEKLHIQEEQDVRRELKEEEEAKSRQDETDSWQKPGTGQQAESDTMIDWEQIERIALPMQPFAWAQDQLYYRLDLKDLKYLPKNYQYLIKNSFVIHGYYNYQYLILGQCQGRIVFGVPGVYHPMEDIVAAFFGFGEFWHAQQQTKQNGCFGYWCRFLY